ncbi:MAG TPA: DNA repair protein RecO C-terminal domain-containing protein, partial [Rhodocyclaceae bacterium]|nr:DNA repair protein RecO C-terminal domain-containing protein [Rhodocyclaceae bacterium]
ELMMRLLPREDAHPVLYDRYADTLRRLALGEPHAALLRAFELSLLRELGYAPTLNTVFDTGNAVHVTGRYLYIIERGVVEATSESSDVPTLSGRALLDMANDDFSNADTLAQAKGLMRRLIQHQLGEQPLESRRILMELQEL